MERWERALNGRFRTGDYVKYETEVKDGTGKSYTIQCSGIITSIDGNDVHIQRERGGAMDKKTSSEIRK